MILWDPHRPGSDLYLHGAPDSITDLWSFLQTLAKSLVHCLYTPIQNWWAFPPSVLLVKLVTLPSTLLVLILSVIWGLGIALAYGFGVMGRNSFLPLMGGLA